MRLNSGDLRSTSGGVWYISEEVHSSLPAPPLREYLRPRCEISGPLLDPPLLTMCATDLWSRHTNSTALVPAGDALHQTRRLICSSHWRTKQLQRRRLCSAPAASGRATSAGSAPRRRFFGLTGDDQGRLTRPTPGPRHHLQADRDRVRSGTVDRIRTRIGVPPRPSRVARAPGEPQQQRTVRAVRQVPVNSPSKQIHTPGRLKSSSVIRWSQTPSVLEPANQQSG